MNQELEHCVNRINDYKGRLPEHMLDGIKRYVLYGMPVGDFLTALFENNLMEVYKRADETNIRLISEYCLLLYNAVPVKCRGSRIAVTDWIELGGLNGLIIRAEAEAEAEALADTEAEALADTEDGSEDVEDDAQ
jgi:hypothetical protein